MSLQSKSAGPFSVVAVKQGDTTLFVSAIKAKELVRLCAGLLPRPQRPTSLESIGVANDKDADELVKSLAGSAFANEVARVQVETYEPEDPYQRLLNRPRVRAIARYLQQEDSLLPNAIILATQDEVTVQYEDSRKELSLTWDSEIIDVPLNIIDGQHRVEGLRLLVSENSDDFGDFMVPVTIITDQPFFAQAILFATINGEQKKVPRSQIYDLLGYKPLSRPELKEQAYQGEMAVQQFCHHASKVLNSAEKSPWRGRIKMRGTGEGIITQAAVVDHMALYMVAKKQKPDMRYLPVLFPYFKQADLVGLSRLFMIYFVGISRAKPESWENNNSLSQSLFGKTNGVAVMFAILHDLICIAGGPDRLQISMVEEKWRRVSNEVVAKPPPGGSKGYQAQVIDEVLKAMLGEDANNQVRKAMPAIRDRLRAEGALIGTPVP